LLAGLLILPLTLAAPPMGLLSPAVLAATLALALLMTAGGNLLYFALLARVGPTRTQLVSFLVPVSALLAGTLLLDEPVGQTTLIGLVIIFTGVGLVARRQPASDAEALAKPHGAAQRATMLITSIGPLYDRHSRRLPRGRGAAVGL
jgi:drug/metabolite transporter (DMT)-like permease